MGKGKAKIQIKKIDNLQRRNVTFTKRRQGLFKKAEQLCSLFPGTRVAALTFSPAGKPYFLGDKSLFLWAATGEKTHVGDLGESASDQVINPKNLCLGGNGKSLLGAAAQEKTDGESGSDQVMNSEDLLLGSGGDDENENVFADLGPLTSHPRINSQEMCLGCESANDIWFTSLCNLESILMSDLLVDDFLRDV